jgi:transcriptional regulator GlxA family with amidase domain
VNERRAEVPCFKTDGHRPWVVGFLLPPEFVLLSYACAIEPLRAANTLAQRELYTWRRIAIDARTPRDLTGGDIKTECRISDCTRFDLVVVCSPAHTSFNNKATAAWLRTLARQRVVIAGVGGGIQVMARAGLLDGYRCGVHWAQAAAFAEEFPKLRTERSLYVIDRRRITCSGGTAPLDLMQALIESQHGRELAAAVGERFVHGQMRTGADAQRASLSDRIGVSNPTLLRAVAAMEQHQEETLSRKELAAIGGVSVRQLERLFKSHLRTTISSCYTRLRLERSRQLLQHTPHQVTAVAIASGFSCLSAFSRAYKQRFGYPPKRERMRQ